MVWRYGGLVSFLVSVHLTVSEKTMSTDGRTYDGRTDARVTTVALLCSSTKQS